MKPKKYQFTNTAYLLAFFMVVIFTGAVLLVLPISWKGSSEHPEPLAPIDALFISTSAVCVTGLTSVNTCDFSRFGQIVIVSLIQIGGLGIISFTSLLLLIPGWRLPFQQIMTIRGFSVDGVEHDPARIARNIIFFTASIESAGALALFVLFSSAGIKDPAFTAVFQSVSAFCNAGFSLFATNLKGFSGSPLVLGVIAALIVIGGIGFIVLQDIERLLRGRRKALCYHSRIVLLTTLILILSAATVFWFLEGDNAFAGMKPLDRVMNALFQAITPRTAGFDAVPQLSLRQPSRLLTILLMFIGGAPGSTAGGIKVSTAFLVFLIILGRSDERGEITSLKRRISEKNVNQAVVYVLKALFLLAVAVGALSLIEKSNRIDFERILFEAVSAFGTVGLSLDLTPSLSMPGKLVIIITMFAGRVGLVAFAFPVAVHRKTHIVYPKADVLIG